jgi:phosphatidylglycerophosphate synthase
VNLPTQLTVGRICLVPLVVAFLIVESRKEQPMLPLELFWARP